MRPSGGAPVRLGRADAVALTLYALMGGLTLGSLIELMWPGPLTFNGILLLSVLSAAMVLLAVLPDLAWCQAWFQARQLAWTPRLRAAGVALPIVWLAVAVWAAKGGHPPCEICEPRYWTQGVSAWPSHLLHLLALFCVVWTIDITWIRMREGLAAEAAWLGQAPGLPRVLRLTVASLATLAVLGLVYLAAGDASMPELPVRGREDRRLIGWTLAACLVGLALVVVIVGEATLQASRFIARRGRSRSWHPDGTLKAFALALGEDNAPLWETRIAGDPTGRQGNVTGPHSLLDDWIDMQLVARRSEGVAPLVIAPFVVLALLVVGRSRLFDSWSITLPIGMVAAVYLLGAIVLALRLKFSTEQARDRALARMEEDLRWLEGGPKPLRLLTEPFKRLIAAVKEDRRGAFAPLFEQPLLKALLLPLGGAGGAQLLDALLMAR